MATVDRRIRDEIRVVWLILFAIVCYFLVYPVSLPIAISKETRASYDTIKDLPAGSVVLLSGSYVSTDPDSYYGVLAFENYIASRGDLKLILFYLINQTPVVGEKAIERTKLYEKMEYGVEVVNLGFVPGGEIAIRDFVEDIWKSVGDKDWYGTPLEDLPIMEDIKDIHDIDLVISVHSASPGWAEWLTQMQAPYDKPFVAHATAAGYAQQIPFFRSGALLGLTKGARGTAELETLTKIPGPATALMSSQSAGHLIILFAVIVGNIRPFLPFVKSKEEEK